MRLATPKQGAKMTMQPLHLCDSTSHAMRSGVGIERGAALLIAPRRVGTNHALSNDKKLANVNFF